jgi:hypothetical protein
MARGFSFADLPPTKNEPVRGHGFEAQPRPPVRAQNERAPSNFTQNWDHAGHVQNDGGDDEGEEGEGEREEDPVGHCVLFVGDLLQKLCA